MTTSGMIVHVEREIKRLKVLSLLTNSETRKLEYRQKIISKEKMLENLKKAFGGDMEIATNVFEGVEYR